MDQGSWNGMIGEALNGNVDIIAADLTITAERAKVLEFTVPFMSAYTTIISRKPERRGSRHGYGGRHQVSWLNQFWFHDTYNCLIYININQISKNVLLIETQIQERPWNVGQSFFQVHDSQWRLDIQYVEKVENRISKGMLGYNSILHD